MAAGLVAAVAARAVGLAGMVEADIACPAGGAAMAGGALPSVVVAGFVASVAALAVGLAGMVEAGVLPTAGVMAICTLPPEGSVMRIVLAVAVHAACRRARIDAAHMALLAGGVHVFTC